MNFRIDQASPADAVEKTFSRIWRERMGAVPFLNLALCVEAVDFQPWQGDWLGIVITPWCMNVLLLPGGGDGWVSTGENRRRFIRFPAGDFAFLGGEEEELGEYQSCSLFSPMDKFAAQTEARMTARASLIALLTPAQKNGAGPAAGKAAEKPAEKVSLSRRRFLALR